MGHETSGRGAVHRMGVQLSDSVMASYIAQQWIIFNSNTIKSCLSKQSDKFDLNCIYLLMDKYVSETIYFKSNRTTLLV